MATTLIACSGDAAERLHDHLAKTLDPIATIHSGDPARVVKPALQRAWTLRFGREMPEPAFSRCVAAITSGLPWQSALW